MERYRVKPGGNVNLTELDPNRKDAFSGGKKEGNKRLVELRGKLQDLQELLYAEHKHKVLIVLQAMDTGGKDGTIRHVFEGVNPQGVRVASFKKPSLEELDHDHPEPLPDGPKRQPQRRRCLPLAVAGIDVDEAASVGVIRFHRLFPLPRSADCTDRRRPFRN